MLNMIIVNQERTADVALASVPAFLPVAASRPRTSEVRTGLANLIVIGRAGTCWRDRRSIFSRGQFWLPQPWPSAGFFLPRPSQVSVRIILTTGLVFANSNGAEHG
jgi:hypothetical protein